jgi:hypothetical protein
VRRRELVALAIVAACGRHRDPPGVIHHAANPIAIDGDWDEPDWSQRAYRGQFVGSDNELARPSSEIRLLHDDHDLFVALYAADDDIESTDAFQLAVGSLQLRVDARGTLTPPDPAIRVKVGFDEGTLDNPHDDDEEWVVELAIPLVVTGLAPDTSVDVRASRCDTPKGGGERCGQWAGALTTD